MSWIVSVAVSVAIVSLFMLLRRPRTITIGTQIAASAVEARRLERTDLGPSPMPPGS